MKKTSVIVLFIVCMVAAAASLGPEKAALSKITTNKDKILVTAVQGRIAQPQPSRGYIVTWDGKPKMAIGTGGINYNLKIGDKVFGWAGGDRATMGVATESMGEDRFGASWLTHPSIGNEVKVIGGEARGQKGVVIGKFGGYILVHFGDGILDKLAIGDGLQIKASGLGLEIEEFEDVRLNKMSPELLAKIGITIEGDQLVVPVVMEIPGHIMGSGLGGSSVEVVDYDIQTTCPEVVEEYGLKKLRLGDLVAIKDHYDYWGRGRYEGAVTIGVVIHGFSEIAGHGPGLNPILSALPGRIKTRLDANANTAYFLGIRPKPRS